MAKFEDKNLNLEKEALPQIQQALKDLSLTLPKLDEDLSPTEKIELSIGDIIKTKDALETLTRYVSSVMSSNGRTPLEDVNLGKYRLDEGLIESLQKLHNIDTCEELSKQNMFDLLRSSSTLLGHFGVSDINKFLVSRGYDSLASKLDNYDNKDFEKAQVKPENALPKVIHNPITSKSISMKPLIRSGINTYGRLAYCSKSELVLIPSISKYSVEAIENHLNSLGIQLKPEDKN